MKISERQYKIINHLLRHSYEETLADLFGSMDHYKSSDLIRYEQRSLDVNFMMWLKRKVQPLYYNPETIDIMLRPLLANLLSQGQSPESPVGIEQAQPQSPA